MCTCVKSNGRVIKKYKENEVGYYNEKLSKLLKQAKDNNFEIVVIHEVLTFKEVGEIETTSCKQKYNLI